MDAPFTAKTALLQVLISGPAYGLELVDKVKEHTKGLVVLGQGSLYPALRGLEEDGLVTSYEAEPTPERGGKPRRYYEITANGLKAAREHRIAAATLFSFGPVLIPEGA